MSERSSGSAPRIILVRMRSGLFTTGEPVRQRVAVARQARQDGESCPVREGVGAHAAPGMEPPAQGRPRFQRFVHPFTGGGDVEQDWLDALHLRETRQTLRFHMGRGKQLRRGANEPWLVRHLAQAKSDTDFFVRDVRVVWRERRIEVALVVFGAPFHRGFQEPFWQTIVGPAQPRQADGQTRHMDGVSQFVGQRGGRGLFLQFHRQQCIRTKR